jgi:hypothetical protein
MISAKRYHLGKWLAMVEVLGMMFRALSPNT